MARQAYPDLMASWEMTIVPLCGLPFGNGLFLHRGGKHPEVAFALGFRPSPFGFVFNPRGPDPDFGVSLRCVAEAVSAILPSVRFVSADPVLLAMTARRPATDIDETIARRHRFMVRRTLAEATEIDAPTPRVRALGIDMERDRALPDRVFGMAERDIPDLVYLDMRASVPVSIGTLGSPIGVFASAWSGIGAPRAPTGHDGLAERSAGRSTMPPAGALPHPPIEVATKHAYGPAFHAPARGSRPTASPPPSFAMIDALIALEDNGRAGGEDLSSDDEPEPGFSV